MTVQRKRRYRPRRLQGGVVVSSTKVRLTGHREVAKNLEGLRRHARHVDALRGGGGGGGGVDGGGGGGGTALGDLGRRLREAAEVIAAQARANAAGWSARIPPSIKVGGGSTGVVISSGAPPAYPNEIPGVRHPVFGGRGTRRPHAPWVTNQHRPFLGPAADERIDEAAEIFAKVIDDWAAEYGFR